MMMASLVYADAGLCALDNSKNQKNIRLFSKILSKWTMFCSKSSNFLEFSRLFQFQMCYPYTDPWFVQNFAKQPYIFWFPKFLELFFTPKNTPPKLRNSKMSLKVILLGHHVYSVFCFIYIENSDILGKLHHISGWF